MLPMTQTMTIRLLTFGIARDICGGAQVAIELPQGATVQQLRQQLLQRFPRLLDLRAIAIAVNSEYARDEQVLHPSDEVALIPPVSGG